MSIKVSLSGKPKDFSNISKIFDEELMKTLADKGTDWQADVKANTPVDTGTLRESWTLTGPEKNGRNIEIELSNNTEYSDHVEYGHRTRGGKNYVKGVYMLRDGTNDLEEELPDALEDAKRRIEARLK